MAPLKGKIIKWSPKSVDAILWRPWMPLQKIMAIVANLWTDWQTLPCPVCSHKVITVVLIIQTVAVVSYLFAFLASVLDSWLVIWSFVREHLCFVMLSNHCFLKHYSYHPSLVFVKSWCIWCCFPKTIDWSHICILKIRHLFMIIFMWQTVPLIFMSVCT